MSSNNISSSKENFFIILVQLFIVNSSVNIIIVSQLYFTNVFIYTLAEKCMVKYRLLNKKIEDGEESDKNEQDMIDFDVIWSTYIFLLSCKWVEYTYESKEFV